ncbi:MAG: response regulator [Acidobacteria bacterium]|nr:response regulator [Acidobacteriota bacterium]
MTLSEKRPGTWRLVLALFLAAPTTAGAAEKPAALDPTGPIRQYVHQKWGQESKLPVTTLLSLAQTSDGYLWIGTEEGLVRFDGVTFETFTTGDSPGLAGNYINTLLVTREGSLLIGTGEGGFSLLDDGRFTAFGLAHGLLSEKVSALLEARDGTIWIGTGEGLQAWDRKTFRSFTGEHGLPSGKITALAEDRSGDLWVAAADKISRFDGRNFTTYEPAGGAPVKALLAVEDSLWIGTSGGGLVRLEDGNFHKFSTADGLSGDNVLSLAQGTGAIWIGTGGASLDRYAGGEFASFDSADGLVGENVWTILEDRDGSVWSGGAGGLNRFKTSTVLTYGTRDGLSHQVVLPILQTRSGDVWIGTAGGGLNRYRKGSFDTFTTREGLSGDIILSLWEEADGSLLVATVGGLDHFHDGRIDRYEHADQMFQAIPQSLHRDRDGALWIGTTDRGVIRIEDGEIALFTTREGIAGNSILDIHEDREGALWFASDGGGLTRYSEGRFSTITTREGLPTNVILSITEGSDGSLWLGSVGAGLIRIFDGAITSYGPREGFSEHTVYRALEDDLGRLWLSSTRGITAVEVSALDELAAGRIDSISPLRFDRDHGMKSSECNGGVDPAGWKMRDGTLWFPTMDGVAVIDPVTAVRRMVPPSPVVIERVVIEGAPVDPGEARLIERLAGKYDVEIAYTSPSLYDPEGVEFRYQLVGFDPGWIDAGARRAAYYTQLPPGNYHFRVAAVNGAGVVEMSGDPIELRIRPRLTQRPLFYIGLLLVAAAAVIAIYRYRLRAYEKRQSELVALIEERARAEEALRQSEQHFRSLIENASDIILALDLDGRILYASPSTARVLGYRPEQIVDRLLSDLVHPEDEAAAMVALREKTSSSSSVSVSFRLRHSDGSWRSLEAVARRLAETGAADSLVVNCRDVTDRNLLQSQLEQAHRLTSLGSLAATIAHEFNNVLMGVQPFTEIIQQKSTGDPLLQSAAKQISSAVDRGRRITGEVLRYARPSEATTAPFDVEAWLRNLEPELRALVGPDIELLISVDDAVSGITGDVLQLNQVMTNLVLNARQALGDSGRIEIDALSPRPGERYHFGVVDSPEQFVHLLVRDSGTGMSDEVRRRVFEPLFTTKRTGGTGLGLTVAHQVVQGHGGEIIAESTPGEGSVFHLFLPRSENAVAQFPEQETPLPESSGRALSGLRIVLVEDDESVRLGVESLLKSENMEVESVTTGRDALPAIAQFRPDLVILDLGLPDMDGIDVYRDINGRWPELPVIFSSGHGDQSRLEKCLDNPRVGFLLKPYDGERLFQEIRVRLG